MNKPDYLEAVTRALKSVHADPTDQRTWHELAQLVDGRTVNYESSLATTQDLEALDVHKVLSWSEFVWKTVHERFPDDTEALLRLAEYELQIMGDVEAARPYVDALLQAIPNEPNALRWGLELALADGDEHAESRVLALARIAPEVVLDNGLLDGFENWEFAKPVEQSLKSVLEQRWANGEEVIGYEKSLHEALAELLGEVPAVREVQPPAAEAWTHLDLAVDELELSVSAYGIVAQLGITTVGELIDRTDADLRASGAARSVVHELNALLGQLGGLSLGAGKYRP